MMTRFLFFLFCFQLGLISVLAQAQTQSLTPDTTQLPDLHIVTTEFPPYSYSVHLQLTGLATEVVNATLAKSGVQAKTCEIMPWARAYKLAQTQANTLIYSIARTPDREDRFIWIGAIAPYQIKLYKLRAREDIQLRTLEDAKAYMVGGELADVKQAYLKKQGFIEGENLRLVADDELNLRMLFAGRIDLLPFNEFSLPLVADQLGLDASALEPALDMPEISYDLYMALSKTSSNALATRLQKSLQTLEQAGTLNAIQGKYLGHSIAGVVDAP